MLGTRGINGSFGRSLFLAGACLLASNAVLAQAAPAAAPKSQISGDIGVTYTVERWKLAPGNCGQLHVRPRRQRCARRGWEQDRDYGRPALHLYGVERAHGSAPPADLRPGIVRRCAWPRRRLAEYRQRILARVSSDAGVSRVSPAPIRWPHAVQRNAHRLL